MLANILKHSFLHVQALDLALLGVIMMEMENKRCLDAQFAEITKKIIKVFEID
jgi:hypothetical protein